MKIALRFSFAATIVIVAIMACAAGVIALWRGNLVLAIAIAVISIAGSYMLAWIKDNPHWHALFRFVYAHLPESILMAAGCGLLAKVSDDPQLGWLAAIVVGLIVVAVRLNSLFRDLSLKRALRIALMISVRFTLLSLLVFIILQGIGSSTLNPMALLIGVMTFLALILPWQVWIAIWSRLKWIVAAAAIFIIAQEAAARLAALPRRIYEVIVYALVVSSLTLASLLRFRSVDRFLARLIDWLADRSD
jgi:hypothetical protein